MSTPLIDLPPAVPTHPSLENARFHKDPADGSRYILEEDKFDGRLRVLTMNRLKSKNGFDDWMYLAFADALNQAAKDEKVLVVLITSNGDYFSSGADLRASSGEDAGSLKTEKGMFYDPVGVFMRTVIQFPKVLVGAVNGPAIGVGATLLPHCDIVYGVEDGFAWTPFTRIAVVPEFCSTVTFARTMGQSVANEMLLLARKVSNTRLRDVGFYAELFPKAGFLQQVLARIEEGLIYPILERTLPLFKTMTKREAMADMEKICLYELNILQTRTDNGDTAEAVIAFMKSQAAAKGRARL